MRDTRPDSERLADIEAHLPGEPKGQLNIANNDVHWLIGRIRELEADRAKLTPQHVAALRRMHDCPAPLWGKDTAYLAHDAIEQMERRITKVV